MERKPKFQPKDKKPKKPLPPKPIEFPKKKDLDVGEKKYKPATEVESGSESGSESEIESDFPSYPATGKEIISFLSKSGFERVSQKGSHVKLKGPADQVVIVPNHPGAEIPRGTLGSIRKQAGY